MQPELLDDYVSVIGPSLRIALTATAVRHRSLDARLLMGWAAMGRAGSVADLLTAARAGDRRWLARIRRSADVDLLAGLAQIVALQDILPTDREDALALYELIRVVYGARALSPANQSLHAQLTLAWQGPERVPRLMSAYRRMSAPAVAALAVDLGNPFVADRPVAPWLAAFRALLPEPRPTLEGDVRLPPFDRLTTPVPGERIEAPQRVSVVVTAYRPDQGLITAVRSILAQTWRNVEVIIVDDGSPPEFDEILAGAVALGERIRLVKQSVNQGTYAARNAGLDASGGEFVAFQDSDDWSHPRRLELQVAPLLADKRLVATTSDGMAVTEDLILNRPGVRRGRFNPSSLMLRRTPVLDRVGYFDPVRKAADSEFIERLEAVFGPHLVRHVDEGPLALIRLSDHSLSRSEIRVHWMHPARVAYRSAYLRWHRAIAAGEAEPRRPADGRDRPFAAPPHLLGGRTVSRAYDVVLVGDWRFTDGPVRAATDEIVALVAAGLRVAIAQLGVVPLGVPAALPDVRADPAADQRRPDRPGAAGRPGRGEAADRAAGRGAAVRRRRAERVPAGRVLLVADRAPARGDGTDRRYDTTTCTLRARRLFGVEPRWCPQDAGVRAALGDVTLTRDDLPPIVDSTGWSATRDAATAGLAIVGTDLCDAGVWPGDPRDALVALRGLVDVDVRLRRPDRPPPQPGLGRAAVLAGVRRHRHRPAPVPAPARLLSALPAPPGGRDHVPPGAGSSRGGLRGGAARAFRGPVRRRRRLQRTGRRARRDPPVPRRARPVRRTEPPRPGRGGQGAPPATVRGPDRRSDPSAGCARAP